MSLYDIVANASNADDSITASNSIDIIFFIISRSSYNKKISLFQRD